MSLYADMNALRKYWVVLFAFVVLVCGLIWQWSGGEEQSAPVAQTAVEPAERPPDSPEPAASEPLDAPGAKAIESKPDAAADAAKRAEIEGHKKIDREHLQQIHGGLFAYKKAHGHFPEYLSQLVPEFVSADALTSPRTLEQGMNYQVKTNHPDPGLAKAAFGFEFSNLVFRDGRTFEQIKEVQRQEWGDAVPILRAFGYDTVINMSYGGDLYETELNWEWDPATLDVVQARGWGPGLTEGQFTNVRVVGADGRPVPGAQVWADGRHYSFDLPNRPFATDANGIAHIPLGADLDRTSLSLRVDGGGLASPAVAFPHGEPPESFQLIAQPAQTVGGQLLDAQGNPVANTWVYLKGATGNADDANVAMGGVNLGAVKTDAYGRWSATLNPSDAAAFNLAVGVRGRPPKFSPGESVDAQAAANGNAVTIIRPAGAGRK